MLHNLIEKAKSPEFKTAAVKVAGGVASFVMMTVVIHVTGKVIEAGMNALVEKVSGTEESTPAE